MNSVISVGNIKPSRLTILNEYLKSSGLSVEEFNKGVLSEDGVWLGGGSLRTFLKSSLIGRDDIQDLDLFFRERCFAKVVEDKLISLNFKCVFRCPLGEIVTYKLGVIKIQLILKFLYQSSSDLVKTFDINAGCAAWDGKTFTCLSGFIGDVKNSTITLNKVTYPVSTIKRVYKYQDKGYYLSKDTIVDLVDQINKMDVIDYTYYID